MNVGLVLALALAGGAGAGLRYVLDRLLPAREGVGWGILLANVTGSFALGVITGLGALVASDLALILGVGLLGGYTTFSTVSVETALLAERRKWAAAAFTLGGTLVLSFGAAALGFVVVGAGTALMLSS